MTVLQGNRNKRSLTLDTTTAEGAEITRRLVAGADVVVANMPAAATASGDGGPYSDRIGFDGTGQVMSGAESGDDRTVTASLLGSAVVGRTPRGA